MNKKGIAIEEAGEIILAVIGVIVILAVGWTVLSGQNIKVVDNACRWEVMARHKIEWDVTNWNADPFFCNQDDKTIIIDANNIQCDGFINFEKDEMFATQSCPYIIKKCPGSNTAATEDVMKENCNYEDLCEKNKKENEIKKMYIEKELLRLLERCQKMTKVSEDEKFEQNLVCFELKIVGYPKDKFKTSLDIPSCTKFKSTYENKKFDTNINVYEDRSKLSENPKNGNINLNVKTNTTYKIKWLEKSGAGEDGIIISES